VNRQRLPFQRFYKYDFASTQVFIDLTSKYYGVSISAHVLAYTPTSVVQLVSKVKKPFFIDPITYVFARSIKNISRNGRMRRSFRKLVESDYGTPFSQCVANNSAITPFTFKDNTGQLDDSAITSMCKKVLQFQLTKCATPTSFPKYAKLLKKGVVLNPLLPTFLVAPYFVAERHGDDWYRISLRAAQLARSLKQNLDLYPVICISRDILWDPSQVKSVIKDYAGHDGYVLWVDDFDETALTPSDISGAKELISGLAKYGKPVYSLYGGYLCDLFGKIGLSGYSSGICYGEKRSVDAVGGGAGNRYYVTISHTKISEDLANAFFAQSQGNLRYMCSCQTCNDIRTSIPSGVTPQQYADRFFAQMDFLDFRRHFVNVKYIETNALESMTKEQVIASLDSDIASVSSIDPFPGQQQELKPYLLRTWKTLFS
jgi:hypothetical protein